MTAEPPAGEILDETVRIPRHVVYRGFAHETVVLNLESGTYHGLNPTAGRMLEVLENAPSVRDALTSLAGEYDVPLAELEQDLSDLCRELLDRGLLEIGRAGPR